MGAGLPTAMTAALVGPVDRRVVAVCGDGGFMMNVQDLETLRRLEQNVTVVVLRDDAYGFIRWEQAAEGFADYALTFDNPDLVARSESFGIPAVRVSSELSLAEAIRRTDAVEGPTLIDCPIAYPAHQPFENDLCEVGVAMLSRLRG
jgi:acetolactate synthase-1/2/3 large subunit